jgi:hypothetical protein
MSGLCDKDGRPEGDHESDNHPVADCFERFLRAQFFWPNMGADQFAK